MEHREVISFNNDEFFRLSLFEFCKACRVNADDVFNYIDFSVIKLPFEGGEWRFNSICIRPMNQAG